MLTVGATSDFVRIDRIGAPSVEIFEVALSLEKS